ncbi:helix-turn-helix transcriptional regulator [Streptomyces violaceusniger]|uniref:helix-turn-helix transcriptional regulator n=1 Tax=Streptomyces violaceusniger TaxID=68280 RepID=UPI0037FEAB6F
MTTRPMLTQRQAAAACGVSRSTIRRRREAGDLPHAVQDEHRGWLIPVEDLLAAGFRLHAPAPPDPDPSPSTRDHDHDHDHDQDVNEGQDVAALRAELERMRHEHALALAQSEAQRRVAETEAQHLRAQLKDRADHIADLQQALTALMPAPERTPLPAPATPAASVPSQTQPEPEDTQTGGGGWLSRLRGRS